MPASGAAHSLHAQGLIVMPASGAAHSLRAQGGECFCHHRDEGHTVSVRVTYEDGDSERFVREAIDQGNVDVIVAAGGDGSVNQVHFGHRVSRSEPENTILPHCGAIDVHLAHLHWCWWVCKSCYGSPSQLILAGTLSLPRMQITQLLNPQLAIEIASSWLNAWSSTWALQLAGALIKADAPETTALAVIPMGTANDFATAAGIPEDPWEALQLAVHDTAHPVDVGLVNDEVSRFVSSSAAVHPEVMTSSSTK